MANTAGMFVGTCIKREKRRAEKRSMGLFQQNRPRAAIQPRSSYGSLKLHLKQSCFLLLNDLPYSWDGGYEYQWYLIAIAKQRIDSPLNSS